MVLLDLANMTEFIVETHSVWEVTVAIRYIGRSTITELVATPSVVGRGLLWQ